MFKCVHRMCLALLLAGTVAGQAAAVPGDNPYAGGTLIKGPKAAEGPSSRAVPEDVANRMLLQEFADCAVRYNRPAVLKAVRPAPWTKEAEKNLPRAAPNRCLAAGEIAMDGSVFRGALYGSLYRETFARTAPLLAPTPVDFRQGAAPPYDADTQQAIGLLEFGDCVGRRDPATVHALLRARPGSSAESSAISSLAPSFSACLTRGSTIKLNKMIVLGVLAETMYRSAQSGTQLSAAERGK